MGDNTAVGRRRGLLDESIAQLSKIFQDNARDLQLRNAEGNMDLLVNDKVEIAVGKMQVPVGDDAQGSQSFGMRLASDVDHVQERIEYQESSIGKGPGGGKKDRREDSRRRRIYKQVVKTHHRLQSMGWAYNVDHQQGVDGRIPRMAF